MTCAEAGVLIERYLDGEVTPSDAHLLDAHVGACPACRELRARETSVDAMFVAAFRGLEPSSRLRANVRAQVQKDAEPAAWHVWLPDVLNVMGVLAVSMLLLPALSMLDSGTRGYLLVALGVTTALTIYPLLVAHDARHP
jgi:predicted anti-sigma-YlaC factor YlaD